MTRGEMNLPTPVFEGPVRPRGPAPTNLRETDPYAFTGSELADQIEFEEALRDYNLKLQNHERFQGVPHPGRAPDRNHFYGKDMGIPDLGAGAEELILRKAGVTPGMSNAEALQLLDNIEIPGMREDLEFKILGAAADAAESHFARDLKGYHEEIQGKANSFDDSLRWQRNQVQSQRGIRDTLVDPDHNRLRARPPRAQVYRPLPGAESNYYGLAEGVDPRKSPVLAKMMQKLFGILPIDRIDPQIKADNNLGSQTVDGAELALMMKLLGGGALGPELKYVQLHNTLNRKGMESSLTDPLKRRIFDHFKDGGDWSKLAMFSKNKAGFPILTLQGRQMKTHPGRAMLSAYAANDLMNAAMVARGNGVHVRDNVLNQLDGLRDSAATEHARKVVTELQDQFAADPSRYHTGLPSRSHGVFLDREFKQDLMEREIQRSRDNTEAPDDRVQYQKPEDMVEMEDRKQPTRRELLQSVIKGERFKTGKSFLKNHGKETYEQRRFDKSIKDEEFAVSAMYPNQPLHPRKLVEDLRAMANTQDPEKRKALEADLTQRVRYIQQGRGEQPTNDLYNWITRYDREQGGYGGERARKRKINKPSDAALFDLQAKDTAKEFPDRPLQTKPRTVQGFLSVARKMHPDFDTWPASHQSVVINKIAAQSNKKAKTEQATYIDQKLKSQVTPEARNRYFYKNLPGLKAKSDINKALKDPESFQSKLKRSESMEPYRKKSFLRRMVIKGPPPPEGKPYEVDKGPGVGQVTPVTRKLETPEPKDRIVRVFNPFQRARTLRDKPPVKTAITREGQPVERKKQAAPEVPVVSSKARPLSPDKPEMAKGVAVTQALMRWAEAFAAKRRPKGKPRLNEFDEKKLVTTGGPRSNASPEEVEKFNIIRKTRKRASLIPVRP